MESLSFELLKKKVTSRTFESISLPYTYWITIFSEYIFIIYFKKYFGIINGIPLNILIGLIACVNYDVFQCLTSPFSCKNYCG